MAWQIQLRIQLPILSLLYPEILLCLLLRWRGDHLSIAQMADLKAYMILRITLDIAPAAITQHLKKSPAEIELIRAGTAIADVGRYAIRDAIHVGVH